MINDVFSFDDFLSKNGKRKPPSAASLREMFEEDDRLESQRRENIETSEDEVSNDTFEDEFGSNFNEPNFSTDFEPTPEIESEFISEPEFKHEFEILGGPESSHTIHDRTYQDEEVTLPERKTYHSTNESAFVNEEEDDNYYKLYQDKNEEFACDIMIEGSSPEETYARIIIESENWSLVFPGEIRNGKCIVPIKKLNILKEGEIGNIKLEVVAEGNLFTPWEEQFKVKMSKKVTVMMNENKKQQKKPIINNKIGVKVNVK